MPIPAGTRLSRAPDELARQAEVLTESQILSWLVNSGKQRRITSSSAGFKKDGMQWRRYKSLQQFLAVYDIEELERLLRIVLHDEDPAKVKIRSGSFAGVMLVFYRIGMDPEMAAAVRMKALQEYRTMLQTVITAHPAAREFYLMDGDRTAEQPDRAPIARLGA